MIILLYFFSFSGKWKQWQWNVELPGIVELIHLIYFVKCESER